MNLPRRLLIAAAAATLAAPATAQAPDTALAAALASPSRSPTNVKRDRYRHSAELLKFFGLKPTDSVLEIQPGGGYWTEILAPYLQPQGSYTAAVPDLTPHEKDLQATFSQKFPDVHTIPFGHGPLGAPGSFDLILSFRNLHDWLEQGRAKPLLEDIYTALKPGGIFGIEDHRAPADKPQDPKAANGYVREDYAKALVESVGFKFLTSSQLGDNPKDTKNYPDGVWDLPPTLRGGEKDRAKYLAIGESDRWTLKFTK
ncbi:class I SAM-dependent methyltransferase [Acidocella aromatica]|uniref:Putative methyltransferase n=1 Tax=Acidocella aromatica TaxID=1303579 RepID=A0A840VQ45_9PROT|nr:putative methyltransferase [Acidocella aromatica]